MGVSKKAIGSISLTVGSDPTRLHFKGDVEWDRKLTGKRAESVAKSAVCKGGMPRAALVSPLLELLLFLFVFYISYCPGFFF